ncbi:3-oxoacyl-ACP synthase [[Phormidium ambiguum] IAM M-71]|uniref:3-oxoacyl-ACP synthase n=1 Tax=[Phormidium ambiguum] IAM M-71 TaxID=454136 RepID=A0A1U7I301_9CYAN|nr:beta-ketoacyl-ACP synthase [Phormidium ambiguum]OKH30425.1 3-oxoacyl-ACP synthase [Phormidium ambiguum IAM M-71]
MNVKIFITGIGFFSALGDLDSSWQSLLAGKSAIKLRQPFSELKPRPLAMIGDRPTELLTLTQKVVEFALKDAGLNPPLPDCGVVIGSSRSQQARWEQFVQGSRGAEGQRGRGAEGQEKSPSTKYPVPSPLFPWLESLPNMAAICAARKIGATGAVLAPMAACATGIWALAQGFELIQTGQCQRVIAGAVETPITPLTLAGFQQMGALAQTGAYPFDKQREGLVLGEGAAVFVLETEELARARGAKVYGEVLGFGLTADAFHANAPEVGGKSAIYAVKQCLERSNLSPIDINYIHAHGTGTVLNDRNEAQLIKYLFPQNVAVSSTKGATGHTLGASGVLGVAFSLLGLRDRILPLCVGLRESEFDLNLVRVARSSEIQNLLCFSFGFGGQNAVIALGKI